jgi:hypothetical protein
MRTWAWLLLAACATAQAADIYRSTGEYGEPVYSNKPQPGATKVEVPPLTIVPSVPVTESAQPAGQKPRTDGYQQLAIVTPTEDAPVRDNAGNVRVGLQVRPPLQNGDRIRIYLDGAAWGNPFRSTSITLNNVPRGAHTLQAAIVGPAGAELVRSQRIIFYLQRVSVLLQKPPKAPGGATRPPSNVPGGAGGEPATPQVPGGAH